MLDLRPCRACGPGAISRLTLAATGLVSRDLGLLYALDEMQHQHRVDLADRLEVFLLSPWDIPLAPLHAQPRRLCR